MCSQDDITHKHVGGIQASDAKKALHNARALYADSETKNISIWVVPSCHIYTA